MMIKYSTSPSLFISAYLINSSISRSFIDIVSVWKISINSSFDIFPDPSESMLLNYSKMYLSFWNYGQAKKAAINSE